MLSWWCSPHERTAANAPELGFALRRLVGGAWRWSVAHMLLSVPFGLLAAWYLRETGFDFFEFVTSGRGHGRFINTIRWGVWLTGLAASVWALRGALWKHGIAQRHGR